MLAQCLKQLDLHHLRRTKNREVLLAVLHRAAGPLSPPDLVRLCHQAGRAVNKTTVYRDLELFQWLGLVHRVMVNDHKQYFELTERGHHHHFVCLDCATVQDIHIADQGLLAQAKTLGAKLRFEIEHHAVEFFGRCQSCLRHKVH